MPEAIVASAFEATTSLVSLQPSAGRTLELAAGSVLDFVGDAFVNAANEGCVGGFGIDEVVNQSGGPQLKEARKALGGCATGSAKVTPAFEHTRCSWIVHAVGPVYRVTRLKQGFDEDDARAEPYMRSLDPLLCSAYHAALEAARSCGARSLGFCLLSAGVFRGARRLEDVVEIGVRTLAHALAHAYTATPPPSSALPHDSLPERVVLYAYTAEEQAALRAVGKRVQAELAAGGDGSGHPLVRSLLLAPADGTAARSGEAPPPGAPGGGAPPMVAEEGDGGVPEKA